MAERRHSGSVRARIAQRGGGRCAYCGDHLRRGWHLDHVAPLRRDGHAPAGSDDEANLVAACGPCNRLKSVHSIEEFRSLIARQVAAARRQCAAYRTAVRFGLVIERQCVPVRFYFEGRDDG